jgi:hypothetical protein
MKTKTNKLAETLQVAKDNGAPKPCFRLEGLRFTLAKPNSANPGYVYVYDERREYLGKIAPNGEFLRGKSVEVTILERNNINSATHAPYYSASEHGKDTGVCSCCGRTLTNPLSIELGIGPICRGYYFPQEVEDNTPTSGEELDLSLDALQETFGFPTLEDIPSALSLEELEQIKIGDVIFEERIEIGELVSAFTRLSTTNRLECLVKMVETLKVIPLREES